MAYQWNTPYSSLLLQPQAVDESVLRYTQNRAKQIGQQQSARGGFSSSRGVALNTENRLMEQALIDEKNRERQNLLDIQRGNTQVASLPQAITPTWGTQALQSLGSLAGNVAGTFGTQMAKGLANKALGTWGMTAPDAVKGYQEITQGYIPSAFSGREYTPAMEGGWTSPYVGPTGGDTTPYSDLISSDSFPTDWLANTPSIWDTPDAFNFDWGNVWGL